MRYIEFSNKTEKFYASKSGHSSQSKPKTLEKVFFRLQKTLERNPNTALTPKQKIFYDEFEKYAKKQKKYVELINLCNGYLKANKNKTELQKEIKKFKEYKAILQKRKRKPFH